MQDKQINRYDKYKNSGIEWIGKIPDSWCLQRLKTVGDYRNGLTYSPEDICEENNGTLVLRSSNIKEGKMSLDDNVYVSSNIPQRLKVKKGDILICSRNGSRELIGKNAVITSDINASFGAFMMIFRCNSPKYFYYILNSHIFNYYLGSFFTSTINQLTGTNFGNMRIVYCPNIKEQKTIADYLDKKCGEIDEIVDKQKAVIEKLKEYKQSIITEAVTKGLDKSVPLKDSGIEWIGKIPQHWDSIKLKFCSYIRARLGWKGLKAEEYVEEGFPLLSAFNIVNNKLIFENLNYINQYRYDESPEIQLQINDILLVKDGAGIGKCAIIEDMPIQSTANGSLAVISTNYRLVAKFLYYYFLSKIFQEYIDRLKDGMGVPHLFQADLKEIEIVIPNELEQKEIVGLLDHKCSEIDKTIEDKEKLIEKLTEYKKSLIYECVTGKRKVVA